MSFLDELEADSESAMPVPRAHQLAHRWPVIAVLGVSGLGLLLAAFRSPLLSTFAYVVLLIVGCGLLFYRRYDAIKATRDAGGSGVLSVQRVEKGAIAALALACLANGVVIALEVATWPFWSHLHEQVP